MESIDSVKTHPLVGKWCRFDVVIIFVIIWSSANPLTSDARSFVLPPDVQQTYVDLFNTSLTMNFDLKNRYNPPEGTCHLLLYLKLTTKHLEAEQTKSKEAGEVERLVLFPLSLITSKFFLFFILILYLMSHFSIL